MDEAKIERVSRMMIRQWLVSALREAGMIRGAEDRITRRVIIEAARGDVARARAILSVLRISKVDDINDLGRLCDRVGRIITSTSLATSEVRNAA